MAGVTGHCKECGFVIFDEQTRTMLCEECEKLEPLDRISGKAERARRDKEHQKLQARLWAQQRELNRQRAALDRQTRLQELAEQQERHANDRNRFPTNTVDLVAQNAKLLEEVKALRKRMEANEDKDESNVSEVKSFLRKFDNLDVESEL